MNMYDFDWPVSHRNRYRFIFIHVFLHNRSPPPLLRFLGHHTACEATMWFQCAVNFSVRVTEKKNPKNPPCLCFSELGFFTHTSEDDLVCRCTNEKIPHFNAPVYLQNKEQIGKVDEIFGPIRDFVSFGAQKYLPVMLIWFEKPKAKAVFGCHVPSVVWKVSTGTD